MINNTYTFDVLNTLRFDPCKLVAEATSGGMQEMFCHRSIASTTTSQMLIRCTENLMRPKIFEKEDKCLKNESYTHVCLSLPRDFQYWRIVADDQSTPKF